jgi:hypothetical protein
MRRYSKSDEQSVRAHALVREWTRSDLLNGAQGARLGEEAKPDLKRTNNFLRAVLFLFTGLIVGAALLLAVELLELRGSRATSAASAVAAVLCFGSAEFLIGRFRVYRFGIEEALAVAAVVLLVIAAGQMAPRAVQPVLALMLSVGALGSLVLYYRFGFLYAGVAAIACAAMLPFQLVQSAVMQRVLAGAMLGGVFVVAGRHHLFHGDDFPGDDYAVFQAVAWAGIYLVVNLQMTFAAVTTGWFYWTTYGVIWLLPIVGLRMSIRKKDRLLMDVSAAMALATLATNKSYLGSQRQTWDPILLGLLLMGTAILIRRWLASGANGERYGFTPARLLSKDARLMSVVSTAAAAFQPQPSSPEPAAPRPRFDGGRSGGGGATGEF